MGNGRKDQYVRYLAFFLLFTLSLRPKKLYHHLSIESNDATFYFPLFWFFISFFFRGDGAVQIQMGVFIPLDKFSLPSTYVRCRVCTQHTIAFYRTHHGLALLVVDRLTYGLIKKLPVPTSASFVSHYVGRRGHVWAGTHEDVARAGCHFSKVIRDYITEHKRCHP